MKTRTLSTLVLSGFLFISNCTSAFAGSATTATTNDAKTFVQTFYDWYAATQQNFKKTMELETVMKKKVADFTPELNKRLNEDIAAQKKSPDELIGLDFDPFLSTNSEPYTKYLATKVTQKGDAFLVEVHGVAKGKTLNKATVTPEVKQIKGKWQFANFHYGKSEFPENENLLSVLKVLKKGREQGYD
ncbi:MAG: DUF3828 domain-containing protein [Candidatus Melainabacteria bacterium]|nr:MAG: DUF3828 domain-containing protein [Candidatus Melainabacteria bacterium]